MYNKKDKETFNAYEKNAKAWKIYNQSLNYDQIYLEKPAIYSMLPINLKDKKILCIGCGTGEECEYFISRGALNVIGIDYSPNLIKIAKNNFKNVEFIIMSANKIKFENSCFDFVFSSLVMHYIDDLNNVFSQVSQILKPGGKFIFSMFHPLHSASEPSETGFTKSRLLGYKRNLDYSNYEYYGDYLTERVIKNKKLFNKINVNIYHKPLTSIINALSLAKFKIDDIIEPRPLLELKRIDPKLYELRTKIPSFIIFKTEKVN